MSIEKVREYFKKYGIENKIIEFDGDTSTVTLAAKCLGVTDGEIAKSLSFKVNDEPILVIAKGDARIDNKKYKDYFKVKAKMLSFDEVEELIGHKVGGVCPFAIKENVKVYRNVQAVVVEEAEKKAEAVIKAQEENTKKTAKPVLILAAAGAIAAVANLVVQILNIMGIFIY